jgi:cell division protein FtsB
MRAKQWQKGILISVLLLAAAWLASSIWGLAGKAHIAVSQEHEAKWQYQALEDRKTTLEANVAALATERGKDAAIRTAFGVARPGEEVIVVVPPATVAPTTTPSWWQQILNWMY